MQTIDLRIHIDTKIGVPEATARLVSRVTSALYSRMGDYGWASVEVQPLLAGTALQDENIKLRGEVSEHESFIEEISSMLPPSYDADEAVEAIILRFLKDMQELAGIIARLTADYR